MTYIKKGLRGLMQYGFGPLNLKSYKDGIQ